MATEKTEQTREAQRFAHFLRQKLDEGTKMRDIADALGLSHSYLSQLNKGARQGIGAEVIRLVRDKYGVDPGYFYDNYKGVSSYRDYYLPEQNKTRLQALEDSLKLQKELNARLNYLEEFVRSLIRNSV